MGTTILNRTELAKRWGYDVRSITKMEQEGFIHALPGFPGKKYSIREIEKLEGIPKGERDMMSPFERRRLIEEIHTLQKENRWLQDKLGAVSVIIGGYMQGHTDASTDNKET